MAAIEGVIHGREIAPDGAVRRIDLAQAEAPCAGWRLIHLGADSLAGRDWLFKRSGLPETAVYALLEDDTQPRVANVADGVLLNLRGPETDAHGALQRMVSLRIFATADRIVSVERRRLHAFEARVAALDAGEGTEGPGAFIEALAEAVRRAIEPILDRLETAVDGFELEALQRDRPATQRERGRLNAARRAAVLLRRYLPPQAEALRQLAAHPPDWLSDPALRDTLREEADMLRRVAEDIDALRSRAVIISDETALRVAEETNNRLLTLSVVSLVFLPLTFLTGLLGVNLDGIPFAEEGWSFPAFALGTLGVGAGLALFLRWRRLL